MSFDTSNMHVITENGEQCFMWRSNQLTYIAQERQELPQVLATKFGPLATKLDLSYNTLTSFRNINMFTNLSELILDNNYLEDEQLDFTQNLRLKTLSLNKNKLKNLHKLIVSVKVCFPNLEFLSLIGNPLCPTPVSYGINSSSIENSIGSAKNGTSKGSSKNIDLARLSATINGSSRSSGSRSRSGSISISYNNDNHQGELNTNTCLTAQVIHNQHAEFVYQKYRYFIIYHLPNLRFLDSTPISSQERDEALKRCYWMESMNQCSKSNLSDNNRKEMVKSSIRASFNNKGCQAEEDYVDDDNEGNIYMNGQRLQIAGNNNSHSFPLTVLSMRNEASCHGETTSQENQQQQQQQPKGQFWTGAFSRLSYKYTGKNSEGNRFIRNRDL